MLEQAVSSVLYRLTLLEKALHSPEPWSLSVGATQVRAERLVEADGVVFRARFDRRDAVDVPMVSLWCGDELMGARPLNVHGHGRAIDVEWVIRLGEEAVAA
jgi:hypothetical protein